MFHCREHYPVTTHTNLGAEKLQDHGLGFHPEPETFFGGAEEE